MESEPKRMKVGGGDDSKEEAKEGQLINGRSLAQKIQKELAVEVAALKEKDSTVSPHLSVIIVGSLQDSATYVRMKTRACDQVGISHKTHNLDSTVSQDEILALVKQLNNDATVHGILIQLPLPSGIKEAEVLDAISPAKDVDGLHTYNNGELLRKGTGASLLPCTAKGCLSLLDSVGTQLDGCRAVVVGRSNLVGKPTALLLMSRNATVTVCHSHTKGLPSIIRTADVVVAAIGKAEYIKADWLKSGCVVIDVGITGIDDSTVKAGYRLVGDVEKEARKVCSYITPVPGGVGPMTVACLMENIVTAFKQSIKS